MLLLVVESPFTGSSGLTLPIARFGMGCERKQSQGKVLSPDSERPQGARRGDGEMAADDPRHRSDSGPGDRITRRHCHEPGPLHRSHEERRRPRRGNRVPSRPRTGRTSGTWCRSRGGAAPCASGFWKSPHRAGAGVALSLSSMDRRCGARPAVRAAFSGTNTAEYGECGPIFTTTQLQSRTGAGPGCPR